MSKKSSLPAKANSSAKPKYDLISYCGGCGRLFNDKRRWAERATIEWRDGDIVYSARCHLCEKCALVFWNWGFLFARPRKVKNGR